MESVKTQIEKYSSSVDKPILLWLYEHYLTDAAWKFVARKTKLSMSARVVYVGGTIVKQVVWTPTEEEGLAIYLYFTLKRIFSVKTED